MQKDGPPSENANTALAEWLEPAEGLLSKEEQSRHRAAGPTRERLLKVAGRTSPHVKDLLEIIAEHFCDPDCYVFLICRQAATTGWHLKQFRRELGITPKALIQECQRETSSVLLRDKSLKVAVIARLVGFKTASALWRIYYDRAGMPPSRMRHCLRLVVPELRVVGEETRGWYFWMRHHRGELGVAEYRAALDYLEHCFGPS